VGLSNLARAADDTQLTLTNPNGPGNPKIYRDFLSYLLKNVLRKSNYAFPTMLLLAASAAFGHNPDAAFFSLPTLYIYLAGAGITAATVGLMHWLFAPKTPSQADEQPAAVKSAA
jgi:hypothetical protein